MSITITFCLRDGVVLPRDEGEWLAGRAVELVSQLARFYGWADLGAVDTRGLPRRDEWASPPIRGHRWQVSGGAVFTLALVDGSGQLAETRVRTSAAEDPVAAHLAVLAVLRRLDAAVYDGRLDIRDDTSYAETRRTVALRGAFAANARLVGRAERVLDEKYGWSAARSGDVLHRFDPAPPENPLAENDVLEAEIIEDEAPEEGVGGWGVRHSRPTLLEQFLKSRGIKSMHLRRESGCSRELLLNLRLGRAIPSLSCMAAIVAALRRLSREPVDAAQVFERVRGDGKRTLPGTCRLLPPSEEDA